MILSSFHAYLIAAMNPPVERYSVFTRTQEQVIVDGREYDLTSQQYVNFSKNGQDYLQRFNFDSVPQYMYQVEDINIKKTISMEYGHNTVVVCYEIENGSSPTKLNIVPLFNSREILESFVKYIKNGLVPNVFPDKGSEPGYNTVDASLYYKYRLFHWYR